jgi:predicted nucleotidyltransferase component of viral defense system
MPKSLKYAYNMHKTYSINRINAAICVVNMTSTGGRRLNRRLETHAELKNLVRQVVADNVLGEVLYEVSKDRVLAEGIALKGGAGLWFRGSGRKSPGDLDFGMLSDAKSEEVAHSLVGVVTRTAQRHDGIRIRKINGHNFSMQLEGRDLVNIQLQCQNQIVSRPERIAVHVDGVGDFEVSVISMDEQLAEKIAALGNRQSAGKRLNDIYDMYFLLGRNARFDLDLVAKKLNTQGVKSTKAAAEEIIIDNVGDRALSELWDEHTATLPGMTSMATMGYEIIDSWFRDTFRKT